MASIGIALTIYNKEKYLNEALLSVLNQKNRPDQVVAVNDCSFDSSMSIMNRLAPLFKIKEIPLTAVDLEVNKGASNARNVALSILKTDYICFLDGDDKYADFHIEALKAIIDRFDPDIICSSVFMEAEKVCYPSKRTIKYMVKKSEYCYQIPDIYKIIENESLIGGGNVCFRRSLAAGIIFDVKEKKYEDWQFCSKILRKANPDAIYYNGLAGYIYNDDNASNISNSQIADYKTIKPPAIINDLNRKEEEGLARLVYSQWFFNSFKRLAPKGRIFIVFKNMHSFIFKTKKNRYWIGAVIQLFISNKAQKIMTRYFKQYWYSK